MDSKISRAKHRIGSTKPVRTNIGTGSNIRHNMSSMCKGARYRTSQASRVRNINYYDTPKYDMNTAFSNNSNPYINNGNNNSNSMSPTIETNNINDETSSLNEDMNSASVEGYVLPKKRVSTATRGAKHRILSETGNIIVNYTPDFYDAPHEKDMATQSTAKLIGNGFMVTRTGYRVTKSVRRGIWNLRKNYYDKQDSKKYVVKSAKMQRNLNNSNGFNLKRSFKGMVRNQSRKAVNRIAQSDDTSSRIVGKTMRLSINTFKYRKQMMHTAKTIKNLIRALFNGVVGIITSIPAIIVSILTSLPLLILTLVVTMIITIFSASYQTSWGLQALFDNQIALENEFGIEIDIVELSCVQDALGWSRSITYKELERLVAYYYIEEPYINTYKDRDSNFYCTNPKNAKNTDFETGLKRVFDKQNPAKKFNNNDKWGVNKNINKDDINYFSIKAMNKPIIDFYKNYKSMKLGDDINNKEMRAYYGSKTNIEYLINFAKSRYNTNLAYVATFGTPNELPDSGILENGTIAQKAVELGKAKLGCRYWWGMQGPSYFDCSGYVWWCYKTAGYDFGRGTADSYRKLGVEVPKDPAQLKAGDLIIIDWKNDEKADHVIMYIGNNQTIGANGGTSKTKGDNPKACVSIRDLSYGWKNAISIRRIAE